MSSVDPRPVDDLPPTGGPIEAAILFCDLISSSEFASVMTLEEYAQYVESFEEICDRQCKYFFEVYHRDRNQYKPRDYQVHLIGDELAVFVHSGTTASHHADDVYQLICLSQTLKCAWLSSPVNKERIEQGAPSVELAIGIHAGKIWAVPNRVPAAPPVLRGFVINVAKRVETASREGQHFRIMISGAAFKRINRNVQHVLIGPKDVARMKGIVMSIAIHELIDSFIDPYPRMCQDYADQFLDVAQAAMQCNSFDVWIHSCYQVMQCWKNDGKVSKANVELCKGVLNLEPHNAVALFFAGNGLRERKEHHMALLYLHDLTHRWPTFTDGWLELAKAATIVGDTKVANNAVRQALRHGARPRDCNISAALRREKGR